MFGTQGAVTGVGLSIGYPTEGDGLRAGLVVISAAPSGPANKTGILSRDVILKIDDTSTETMGIYDAAECLQWVLYYARHLVFHVTFLFTEYYLQSISEMYIRQF